MTGPRCPRCESRDVEPCVAWLEASDEAIPATHECTKCHTRFRYLPAPPPEREVWP